MTIKYRKKPHVIEAVQWNPEPKDVLFTFPDGTEFHVRNRRTLTGDYSKALEIPTLEGEMIADEGVWIIKGIKGEFYPCRDDIFQATYEQVVEDKPEEE